MSYVIGIKGDNKSGKTTLALSFPKPMVYMETDIGGYNRASHRFDTSEIEHKQYMMPIENLTMKLSGTKGFKKGYREIWEQFAADYMQAINTPKIKTIVIDSFPQLYALSNNCVHQEKEEKQGKIVDRMMPLDYAPSYERMQTIIYWTRLFDKNLVLTHYLTDEYQDVVTNKGDVASRKTGKQVTAGWSKINKELDIMIDCKFDVKNHTHNSEIILCGLAREAVGMIIPDPTWEAIESLVIALREANTYVPH